MSYNQADEHNNAWKGGEVGYSALHRWIRKKLGKPNYCSHCKTTKKRRYEWANISKKYKRKLSDWIRLCVPCHSKYDKKACQISVKIKKLWQNPEYREHMREVHKGQKPWNKEKFKKDA